MYVGGVAILLDCTPSDQCQRAARLDVFSLVPGTALRAEFGFVHSYPEPKEFRVFLLLNYRQTPFAVQQQTTHEESGLASLGPPIPMPDAGEMQTFWDFTVPSEQEFYFELGTEPLAAGYYDLALLIVPDPNKTQKELPYRTIYRFASRASVYVGDEVTPPIVDFPLIDPEPHDDSGFAELLLFGREPYKTRPKGEQSATVGSGMTLDMSFQPYADNLADDLLLDAPVPTAFIPVIDDQVVPLNGQQVFYGSALPVTVTAPDDPGIHQLFVQQFPNPYVDVAMADETGKGLFGESSQRLILDVR